MNSRDLRRRRVALGLSLDDISAQLCDGGDIAAISRFERGYRKALPGGKGRDEYKELLDRLEAAAVR